MKGKDLQKVLDLLPDGTTLILPPMTIRIEKTIKLKSNQIITFTGSTYAISDTTTAKMGIEGTDWDYTYITN